MRGYAESEINRLIGSLQLALSPQAEVAAILAARAAEPQGLWQKFLALLVLNLLLRGHSIKSIAERLKNSLETIKHHRKNIYSKLDVSTQAELFHLFIDSLRSSSLDPERDPLIVYMSLGEG